MSSLPNPRCAKPISAPARSPIGAAANRAYVLQSGTIRHSGTARELGRDPELVRAYLGDQTV
jgi:ABC-type lipopolysaccharide export system ATPase subunit